MEPTPTWISSPSPGSSTFLLIVGLVGHLVLLLLFLIGLRLLGGRPGLISLLLLKLSFLAIMKMKIMDVTEETLSTLINGCIKITLLMRPAPTIKLKVMIPELAVLQTSCVGIVNTEVENAGFLTNTECIQLIYTELSPQPTKQPPKTSKPS